MIQIALFCCLGTQSSGSTPTEFFDQALYQPLGDSHLDWLPRPRHIASYKQRLSLLLAPNDRKILGRKGLGRITHLIEIALQYLLCFRVQWDRSETTCRLLWERVPPAYKGGLLYTDFWAAYVEVLPKEQHRATGKGAGQTCHVERFSNVLRQRIGRLVRRTLSFSKIDVMHENCLRIFPHEYNQPTKRKVKRIRLA